MGTRSLIAMESPSDKSCRVIYCHWDGYPSHNGKVLLEHYTDAQKVSGLMDLGDMSSLGSVLGEKHDWNQYQGPGCNVYGRDRGEEGTEAKTVASRKELLEVNMGQEYTYLFDKTGKWLILSENGRWLTLTPKKCL